MRRPARAGVATSGRARCRGIDCRELGIQFQRGAVANGLFLLSQRGHPGGLVAERGGHKLSVEPNAQAAGKAQAICTDSRRSRRQVRRTRSRRPRRPRPRQRHLLDGGAPEQECHRHSCRRVHRSGAGAGVRASDALSFVGAELRRSATDRRLRLRLFVCVPVQPCLELGQHSQIPGVQSPTCVRAALRRRQARRARREPAAPAQGG